MSTQSVAGAPPASDRELKIAVRTLLGRALRRQCPICGSGDIWLGWISIRDQCPRCEYRFARESGYFLGSMLLNVIFSELLVMALMVMVLVFTAMLWWQVELIILSLAVILPILWNPYFKGFWLTLDLSAHPVKERNVNMAAILDE